MKSEPDKMNKIPYSVVLTTQFIVYMTKEEEDNGDEIPEDIIKQSVLENIENGEYEVQEECLTE